MSTDIQTVEPDVATAQQVPDRGKPISLCGLAVAVAMGDSVHTIAKQRGESIHRILAMWRTLDWAKITTHELRAIGRDNHAEDVPQRVIALMMAKGFPVSSREACTVAETPARTMLVLECLLLGCKPTEAARRAGGNRNHVENAYAILERNGLTTEQWGQLGRQFKRDLHAWMAERLGMKQEAA